MSALLRLLPTLIGLVIGTLLYAQGERLTRRTHQLANANDTITALRAANGQLGSELAARRREDAALRQLLAHQNAALTALDHQHRKIADALKHALATPAPGRPDCAAEPLPAAALRLLKQPVAGNGGAAGSGAAPGRTDTPLP